MFRYWLPLFLLAGIFHAPAYAGSIQIGAPTVESNRYALPITLSGGGDQVSAMDFRVEYDPAVFRPVSIAPGPMALQANKQVIGNAPAPGEYVVIMHGINRNTVGNGEVAKVVFERIDGSDVASRLSIASPTLSDAEGSELPVSGGGRSVGRNDDTNSGGGNSGGGSGGGDLPDGDDPTDPLPDQPGDTPAETPGDGLGTPTGDAAPGAMPTMPLLNESAKLDNVVIPTAKRPGIEPGDTPRAAAGSTGTGPPGSQDNEAGAEARNSRISGYQTNEMDGERGGVNSAERPDKKNLAETAGSDVRIENARLDSGVTPFESIDEQARPQNASANAENAGGASPAAVAGLALSTLLAAAALFLLRRKLFR